MLAAMTHAEQRESEHPANILGRDEMQLILDAVDPRCYFALRLVCKRFDDYIRYFKSTQHAPRKRYPHFDFMRRYKTVSHAPDYFGSEKSIGWLVKQHGFAEHMLARDASYAVAMTAFSHVKPQPWMFTTAIEARNLGCFCALAALEVPFTSFELHQLILKDLDSWLSVLWDMYTEQRKLFNGSLVINAAYYKAHKCLSYLVRKGVDLPSNALKAAAYVGDIECARILIEGGCQMTSAAMTDAVSQNHLPMVEYLSRCGCPLHRYAISHSRSVEMQMFLEYRLGVS